MAGKRSNGEGSILYDKRRKTYRARVTVGWETDEETGRSKQVVKSLGSFKTKGEAASALAMFLKNPYDLDNKDITFSELYTRWIDEYLVNHASFKYRLSSAFKYCSKIHNKRFRDISIYDMKNCINDGTVLCKKGKNKGQYINASPETKESIKYLFNHIYEFAVEARIVENNLAREFTIDKSVLEEKENNKKIKKPFSPEDVEKLWRSIEFVPFADMILYACYSGWRPSELIKIKIEDVHLDDNYITGGIKTKAGKGRIVPINPLVKDIIVKYYNDAIQHNSMYLFNDTSKKKGIGLSYDQYLTRFNNVLHLLELDKNFTPHCTRHTFASKAKSYEVGMDEYILKLIIGHKITDITESVYTHRQLEDLIREMNKITK